MSSSPRPRNKLGRELSLEIVILAGGLSSRMGRDKSKLRVNGRTLLKQISIVAVETRFPVRTIRRDLVSRCGPIGGVYTALKKSSADACLFLACDMPLITSDLLEKITCRFKKDNRPLFTQTDSAGFPFIVPTTVLPVVEQQIEKKQFSLHSFAQVLKADLFQPTASEKARLFNLNTPDDWEKFVQRSI